MNSGILICEFLIFAILLYSFLSSCWQNIQHERVKRRVIKQYIERSKLLEYHICYDQMTYDEAVLYSTFYGQDGSNWRIADADELFLLTVVGEPRRELGQTIWFWVRRGIGTDYLWQYYVTGHAIKEQPAGSYNWWCIANNNIRYPRIPVSSDCPCGVCLVRDR
jgi:hypothetical protein